MKRVLISGVCGLIGSHLADKMLEAGYSVTGLDDLSAGRMANIKDALKDRRFLFRKSDVSDKTALKNAVRNLKFDIVAHMAASKKPAEADSSLKVIKNNLDSTVNMLDIAKRDRAKFIFASTSDVYGRSRDLPFREDGDCVIGPSYIKRWSYAISKLYCENLVFSYSYEYGMKAVVLRYFGCFSARANPGPSGGHVPLFIKRAFAGKEIIIHGDGRQTRSMGYVGDVIEGTLAAIENNNAVGEIINIGTNEEMSVEDSAKIIIKAAKKVSYKAKNTRIKYIPMKKVFGDYREIPRRVPDLKKAKKLLGYEPTVSFKKAVEIVVREMAG